MYKDKINKADRLTQTEAKGGADETANRNILYYSVPMAIAVLALVVGFGMLQSRQSGADQVNAENASVGRTAEAARK